MKTLLVAVLAITVSAASAHAGFYLRGGMLYNSPRDVSVQGISQDYRASIDDSAGFNIAGGFKFTILRAEAEVSYLGTSIRDTEFTEVMTSGDFKRTSFFANALVEIPFTPIIEPYAGVGVGVSQVKMDFFNAALGSSSLEESFSSSADDARFSYQVMLGVRLSFLDTFSVYTGYRYLNADGLTLTEGDYELKANTGAHLFELGVGIGF